MVRLSFASKFNDPSANNVCHTHLSLDFETMACIKPAYMCVCVFVYINVFCVNRHECCSVYICFQMHSVPEILTFNHSVS